MTETNKNDDAPAAEVIDRVETPPPASDLVPLHQVGGLPVPQAAPVRLAKTNR